MTPEETVVDWVGEVDGAVIAAALDRAGGDPHAAALSILRRRRAALTQAAVSRYDIDGDYSETHDLTIQARALDGLIGRLERIVDDTTGVGAGLTVGTVVSGLEGRRR